jgi:short-subunit dehydrogenase
VELTGRTVLLTGATGGLGRAIATALADRGAALILSGRDAGALEALITELPGDGHTSAPADLAEEGEAERLISEHPGIDVLVANAGLPASGRLDGFSQDQIGRALRVNLESPIRMARALIPPMQERGGGHLVFVSSISGRISTPRASIYAATKFGLRGFALNLREDLRRTGVGVSVVSPGTIREAGMFAESGAKPPPGLGTGTPRQVAAAVVKAIERNRGEISVAPRRQRALASVSMFAPELSGRVAGSAATKVADEVARGQTDKR